MLRDLLTYLITFFPQIVDFLVILTVDKISLGYIFFSPLYTVRQMIFEALENRRIK